MIPNHNLAASLVKSIAEILLGGVVGFTFECRISLDNPLPFSAAFFDPEFLCQPVGSFGDKLLCQCLINFNYSSTWDFLLRKDASGSEMENPGDISQECPLHKNSVTRV
jgi:hypothetical protein